MTMAPTFDEIAKAKYILLTTFTKDGRPKPSAIWAAPDGDRLLVITEDDSWTVKRIRNTPRVTLAICDPRGKPKSEPIEAVARVLDKSEAPDVQRAINKRYGILGWLFGVYTKVRGLDKKSVGLELKAASQAA
jgi:PPOX class probable F420-dependent enzyme